MSIKSMDDLPDIAPEKRFAFSADLAEILVPAREYVHVCCKCLKEFTSPHSPGGISFCGYGCT